MEWVPRTIKDAEYEYPYRYQLKDISTGAVISTYDIMPTWEDNPSEVIQSGTEINAAYLQPIEDFLKAVTDDLANLGVEITAVNTNLTAAESNANARIDTANTRLNSVDSALASKAPLNSPALTNPTANTVAITTNSTNLATTAAVKSYLDGLFSSYKG